MSTVALLPPEVADQIAAGEVVERPASVLKELVENALDAGATSVTVTVDGGGLTRLAVADDGSGMGADDAALAVLRHATSKIRTAADLVGVASYGFRGEALPSIASVSRLRLVTRALGAPSGNEVFVEGGAPAVVKPAGCAEGTTVTVDDLFFNTPARRKFMRTPQTEGAACVEALVRLAVPRPGVRFVIRRDGKVVREFLRQADAVARVREVLPDESLAVLRGGRGRLSVLGLLGPPERARSGASHLLLYVNGRLVKDRVLLRAVAQAYGSTLEPGRYPAGAVMLEVPPEDVDVNVHPQKSEVRFAPASGVFEAVTGTLRQAAATAPWVQATTRPPEFWSQRLSPAPVPEPARPEPPRPQTPQPSSPPSRIDFERSVAGPTPFERVFPVPQPIGRAAVPVAYAPPPPLPPPVLAEPLLAPISPEIPAIRDEVPGGRFGALRYVGQLRRMFLVCEAEGAMVILDQHAAAERVNFERLRKAHASRTVAMQPLLVPERVELSPTEVALVEERASELLAMGVDLAPLGATTIAVRGVPALLKKIDPRRLARDVVAEITRQGSDFSRAVDLVLATMACHGSVRAGDEMSSEEVRALLASLDTVDFAGHCPHGRPVVHAMRWSELERRVGR